jgi:methanogenic corrinoid protein MtbC1
VLSHELQDQPYRVEEKNMKYEILSNLKASLKNYKRDECSYWAKKAVEEGVDPIEALDALTEVMQEIGEGFTRCDLFLPDLVAAGKTMEAVIPILNEEIVRKGIKRKNLGTVVIGTVFGDIHNIGKTMVSTLLTAGGFSVHDLGINIETEVFITAVKQYNPDILAMSALLTTTAREQKVVIEALKNEGLRNKIKVMVGGGAINEEFAKRIGADGYSPTAPLAVELAKNLVGKREV